MEEGRKPESDEVGVDIAEILVSRKLRKNRNNESSEGVKKRKASREMERC